MGGPGSGPQKTPQTIIREAIGNDSKNLPSYFERLSVLALDGDREALFYLIDRHLGKPKAAIEVEGGKELGSGVVVELFKLIAERDRKLIGDGDAIQGQGETKELQQGADEGSTGR